MPIYAADNRLMLAEDMSQEDTGGGRMSGAEAPNGQVSAVFAKLARLTFLGKWRAAKVFFGIFTRSQDTAAEAHTVLLRAPTDPLLEVLLFRTGSHTDRLPDAKEYVANYLVPGGDSQMYLYSTVAAGQDVAQWWQRLDQAAPRVGEVFRLWASADVQEDVKLTSIASQELTLYDSEGKPYVRRLLTCRLFAALRNGYTGVPIGEVDPATPVTRTKLMLVNGTVRYYGVKPLAADVASGAQSMEVTSIYGQLVPAVYAPAALTNRPAVATGRQTITSGGVAFPVSGPTHSRAIAITLANQDSVYVLPLAPAPAAGSAVAHVYILQTWYLIYEDPSRNQPGQTLQVANGVATLALGAGFPDLDSLVIFQWASGIHFTDRAGVAVLRPQTFRVTLPELPEAGSVGVAWVSGGVGRSVSESSAMVLSGDGTGFRVGLELALRVGNYLPDGGTQFTVTYQALATVTEIITPAVVGETATFTLADPPRPGSVRVTWTVEKEEGASYKSQSATPAVRQGERVVKTCASSSCWASASYETENGVDVATTESSDRTTQTLTRTTQDDGAGHIGGGGTVIYATGVTALPVTKSYARQRFAVESLSDSYGDYESGNWEETTSAETLDGPLTVTYALAAAIPGAVETLTVPVPPLDIHLLPQYQDDLIPGTWRFRLGPVEYRDGGDGTLYLADGSTVAGSMDYANRVAQATRWTGATSLVTITSGISAFWMPGTQRLIGRTDGNPVSVGQFFLRATTIEGDAITGSGQSDQTVTGTGIAAGSTMRYDTGAFEVLFANPVYPGAVYDCVVQEIMPLSEAQIGIDATRLPRDGRVPLYRQSDAVLVHQSAAADCPTGLTAGQVIDTGVANLAELYLVDEGGDEQTETLPTGLTAGFSFQALSTAPVGQRVCEYLLLKDSAGRHVSGDLFSADLATGLISGATPLSLEGYLQPLIARYVRRVGQSLYSVDLAAGTVTMASPLDLTSYTQPLGRRSRWEDWSRLRKNPVGNTLLLQDEINHDYDAGEALVSGIVEHGDLRARVSNVFFGQATWTSVWSDVVIGTPVSLYDSSNYPPGITNDGAITARMALVFTSSTGFTLWIEDRGAVATGTKSADFAPINPATGYPYVTLYSAGWSVSTATGNALRLNTVAAAAPYWVSLCVSAGDPTMADDGFLLANRTDAD